MATTGRDTTTSTDQHTRTFLHGGRAHLESLERSLERLALTMVSLNEIHVDKILVGGGRLEICPRQKR
jgi:hypothetical protein